MEALLRWGRVHQRSAASTLDPPHTDKDASRGKARREGGEGRKGRR